MGLSTLFDSMVNKSCLRYTLLELECAYIQRLNEQVLGIVTLIA